MIMAIKHHLPYIYTYIYIYIYINIPLIINQNIYQFTLFIHFLQGKLESRMINHWSSARSDKSKIVKTCDAIVWGLDIHTHHLLYIYILYMIYMIYVLIYNIQYVYLYVVLVCVYIYIGFNKTALGCGSAAKSAEVSGTSESSGSDVEAAVWTWTSLICFHIIHMVLMVLYDNL